MSVTLVQTTTTGSLSKAFGSNVTSGNILAVICTMGGGNFTVSSVSDTLGNSYSKVCAVNNQGQAGVSGSDIEIWWCSSSASSGANTVTVHPSSSPPISSICIFEISGTNNVDKSSAISSKNYASITPLASSNLTIEGISLDVNFWSGAGVPGASPFTNAGSGNRYGYGYLANASGNTPCAFSQSITGAPPFPNNVEMVIADFGVGTSPIAAAITGVATVSGTLWELIAAAIAGTATVSATGVGLSGIAAAILGQAALSANGTLIVGISAVIQGLAAINAILPQTLTFNQQLMLVFISQAIVRGSPVSISSMFSWVRTFRMAYLRRAPYQESGDIGTIQNDWTNLQVVNTQQGPLWPAGTNFVS